ncbi:MAG TPA: hypothetical protein VIU63_01740 [Nitrospira sp.]
MRRPTILLLGVMLLVVPAWPVGAETFDPEQPFTQALSHRLLESILNQAMEVIEDHLEIKGHMGSQQKDGPSFQFKFYPEGKSKSDQHFTAEGWFEAPADSDQDQLHLRFAFPKSSMPMPPSSDNVL